MNQLKKLYDISRMLCLLAFRLFQAYFRWFYSCNWYAILVAVFYAICHGRGVIFWHSQTLWIFQSVSTRHYEFFRVFGFTKIPLFIFRPLLLSFFSVKKKLIEGPVLNCWTFKCFFFLVHNCGLFHFPPFGKLNATIVCVELCLVQAGQAIH